ncbi:MAG: hypothetical protein AAF704_12895 [Cyanobacteria bacterium P01_D01_bin.123]
MNLLDNKTLWAFVSGSDEARFINDIHFGVCCLKHRQIQASNIICFVDSVGTSIFAMPSNFPSNIPIHATSEIASVIRSHSPEKVVFVVTGHGQAEGISAVPTISPSSLVNSVKGASNVQHSLFVLGQCYAGTFNYLQTRPLDPNGKPIHGPEFAFIGATDLQVSLSDIVDLSTIGLQGFQCSPKWCANLFLFFFMLFIAFPKDIDGDGRICVIDSYKFAGVHSNESLINAKRHSLIKLSAILQKALSQSPSGQNKNITASLTQQSIQDLSQSSRVVLSQQKSWILNANFARRLTL